jgi:hypothetical protein
MTTYALTELNAQDGFSHYVERANNRTVDLLRPALRLNSAYLERANTKGYKTKRATERNKTYIIKKVQCGNSSTRSQQHRDGTEHIVLWDAQH